MSPTPSQPPVLFERLAMLEATTIFLLGVAIVSVAINFLLHNKLRSFEDRYERQCDATDSFRGKIADVQAGFNAAVSQVDSMSEQMEDLKKKNAVLERRLAHPSLAERIRQASDGCNKYKPYTIDLSNPAQSAVASAYTSLYSALIVEDHYVCQPGADSVFSESREEKECT